MTITRPSRQTVAAPDPVVAERLLGWHAASAVLHRLAGDEPAWDEGDARQQLAAARRPSALR